MYTIIVYERNAFIYDDSLCGRIRSQQALGALCIGVRSQLNNRWLRMGDPVDEVTYGSGLGPTHPSVGFGGMRINTALVAPFPSAFNIDTDTIKIGKADIFRRQPALPRPTRPEVPKCRLQVLHLDFRCTSPSKLPSSLSITLTKCREFGGRAHGLQGWPHVR